MSRNDRCEFRISNRILYKKEMDLRLSPLMIVIGRFEMDMYNLIGASQRAERALTLLVR